MTKWNFYFLFLVVILKRKIWGLKLAIKTKTETHSALKTIKTEIVFKFWFSKSFAWAF